MHERELFGGRVRARSLGDEPVMRAERVASVGAVLGGRSGRGAVRVPFVPFGRLSWSACIDGAVCEDVYGAVGASVTITLYV